MQPLQVVSYEALAVISQRIQARQPRPHLYGTYVSEPETRLIKFNRKKKEVEEEEEVHIPEQKTEISDIMIDDKRDSTND